MSKAKLLNLKKLLTPRKFGGLMEMYDKNYQLVYQLVPDLKSLPDRTVSSVESSPNLYLEILERCKFTTTVRLTYFFEVQPESADAEVEYVPDPDLRIKIYDDAKVVEAVACRPNEFMPVLQREKVHPQHLQCRWDSNLFLQKWLEYSLELGHRFALESIDQSLTFPEFVEIG